MKKQTTLLLTFLCSAASVGCSTAPAPGTGTGTGGTTGGGGAGGAGTGVGVALTPDMNGFVAPDTNEFMAQGAWYAYGDGAGPTGAAPGDCQNAGHPDAECSKIDAPPPMMFPNTAGKMCTSGTVAKVADMVGKPGMPDYSKIWGAGIGLDLNNPGGIAGKGVLDATAKGIKGIQFDLDMKPLAGLRVEAQTVPTDGTEAGNDYWGATMSYPPSPVMPGTNTVMWSMFVGPKGHVFDPTKLEGIQFHVPATTTAGGPYSFCISNMKLLK